LRWGGPDEVSFISSFLAELRAERDGKNAAHAARIVMQG